MRAVSDRQVIGYYKNIADTRKEYQRKVRTVTRGMGSLRVRAEVLNTVRYGRFAFEVFSHKRHALGDPWSSSALCANTALKFRGQLYRVTFGPIRILSFTLGIADGSVLRKIGLVRIGVYFVEVNVAIIHAYLVVARRPHHCYLGAIQAVKFSPCRRYVERSL